MGAALWAWHELLDKPRAWRMENAYLGPGYEESQVQSALDGFGAVTRSLRIDTGLNVNLRSLIGARYVKSGNRNATARAMIEAPSIAVKDYLSSLQTGDLIAWQFVHGTEAGNIVEVGGAKAQVTAISEQDEDDTLMFDVSLLLTVDGGADDLTITAK